MSVQRNVGMRETRWWCLLACLAVGCSGAGSCGGLTPLPQGRYVGPKNDNAAALRLSPDGITFLNANWSALVEQFAPGRVINVPIGCTVVDTNVSGGIDLGKFAFADQGGVGCGSRGCGRMDGQCRTSGGAKDEPAQVKVTITGLTLTPRPATSTNAVQGIEVGLAVEVDTGRIYISSEDRSWLSCLGLSGIDASVRFNTRADVTPPDVRFKATINFAIDQKWDKLLAFEVASVSGIGVCGASGVPAAPQCLQPDDVDFNGENNCADIYLALAEVRWIKATLLRQLSGPLQDRVKEMLSAQPCQPCGMGLPACPSIGTAAVSSCVDGICKDQATNKCVPRFLGVEGRAAVGALLSGFGVPNDAQLDLSVGLGAMAKVDTGITLGTRAGLNAVEVAGCVPAVAAPTMTGATPPNFDAEAPMGSPYHVGLSFSSAFLNQTFHHVQQSGALCLSLTTANVGLVNTGLLKAFLPSLGKLASRTVRDDSGGLVTLDAPMLIALRPMRPPTVTIGKGVNDPMTMQPTEPLLNLKLTEMSIDFYALLDDRYARLFTVTVDVALPIGLQFDGCDKATPVMGDLKMLVTNVRTSNSELLAEDPSALANLIPAIIGLAEPALAGALQPFSLPTLGNLKLKINAAKGIGNISGSAAYEHLGLYATLQSSTTACATSAPLTHAMLKAVHMPSPEKLTLNGPLESPVVELAVGVESLPGTPEYSVRLGDGLWSTFRRAQGGVLMVEHPGLLLQGRQTVWVRSRLVEQPHGLSEPVPVGVVIDWEAPQVWLTENAVTGLVMVDAFDTVAQRSLEYAYAFGDEALSGFGPKREVSLPVAKARGRVRVAVRDPSGNVGEAVWQAPAGAVVAEWGAEADGHARGPSGAGCTTTPEVMTLLGLGLGLRLRRRARQS